MSILNRFFRKAQSDRFRLYLKDLYERALYSADDGDIGIYQGILREAKPEDFHLAEDYAQETDGAFDKLNPFYISYFELDAPKEGELSPFRVFSEGPYEYKVVPDWEHFSDYSMYEEEMTPTEMWRTYRVDSLLGGFYAVMFDTFINEEYGEQYSAEMTTSDGGVPLGIFDSRGDMEGAIQTHALSDGFGIPKMRGEIIDFFQEKS